MKKIFNSILLILFTIQPLVAHGLVYRNSELNIMMSEKSVSEKEYLTEDVSGGKSLLTSMIVGAGIGFVFGLLLAKVDESTDPDSNFKKAGGTIFVGICTLLGGVIGSVGSTYKNSKYITSDNPKSQNRTLEYFVKNEKEQIENDKIQIGQTREENIKIEVGQTKEEIIELLGNPKKERYLTTRSKTNYGAEKEFWHEIEIGTELELWSYDLKDDKLNLYFFKGSNVLSFKAFNPKK